jgi:hypothetical protein
MNGKHRPRWVAAALGVAVLAVLGVCMRPRARRCWLRRGMRTWSNFGARRCSTYRQYTTSQCPKAGRGSRAPTF